MKLIVNINGMVDHSRALRAVSKVIDEGKISEAAGVPHYCWASKFQDGVTVVTHKKRKGQVAETFSVYREDGE